MTKPYDDAAAADFYGDPEHQRPAGPGRRRGTPRQPLSGHVPVRFDEATIGAVKERADAEGITVSAWIRRLVARELAPANAAGTGSSVVVRIPAGTRRVALEIDQPSPSPRRRSS